MVLYKKSLVPVFMLLGVISFGFGTFFFGSEIFTVHTAFGSIQFNPFWGLGIVFFGLVAIKPFLRKMGFR